MVQSLEKRDNMGFAIAPPLIVLLILLGAGMLVMCGVAVHRYFCAKDDNVWRPRSEEQDRYMREVRQRNVDALMREGWAASQEYESGNAAVSRGSRWVRKSQRE